MFGGRGLLEFTLTKEIKMKNLFAGLVVGMLIFEGIAGVASATTVNVIIPGTSDPWLAGMPDGSTASSGDIAPNQSPVQVSGLQLNSSDILTFSATGAVNNGPSGPGFGPDGESLISSHIPGAQNGIANINAPINSLVVVFLSNQQPNLSSTPLYLEFGSSSTQNYLSLSPELQQVFFIGDGITSTNTLQKIVVPNGATRLYLGTMDGYEWSNNYGSFNVAVTESPAPEPATMLLMGSGLAALSAVRRLKKQQPA